MTATPWQPGMDRAQLAQRARLLSQLRSHFEQTDALEVDTPILHHALAPEEHIEPIRCQDGALEGYLHTSPETCMKRLLAAGSGDIYYLGKVFRSEELGRLHNREFTMLEWYRVGWTLDALVTETAQLIGTVLDLPISKPLSYADAFTQAGGPNPHTASLAQLQQWAKTHRLSYPDGLVREELMDYLQAELVEPRLPPKAVVVVDRFPAQRAGMAQIDPGPPAVAQRFEIYVNGVELANGYLELTDAVEQRQRLESVNRRRQQQGLPAITMDQRFLAALQAGLPAVSGVALGVDRLLMLQMGAESLDSVMPFTQSRI
ncbi:EF-P lysine aminoacylase EpmA [Magnetococcus sp. PR-3]|uniref:EF-P lysine aminoacylase EpmA n=1 Tax=Magnetococcus sp. PR-3 TaxID=3120355 RepID=UPI002FCE5A6C